MTEQPRLAISEQVQGATVRLTITGELDLSSVPLLARRLDERLAESPRTLTLDMRDLTFMDSSGLRQLIELDERATRDSWTLTLIPSRHESARTVLRLTGADAALPFQPPGTDSSPA
jgi:anti-sigma B factor antagonist